MPGERITSKTYRVLKEMRDLKAQNVEGLQSDIKTLDAVIARYDAERGCICRTHAGHDLGAPCPAHPLETD